MIINGEIFMNIELLMNLLKNMGNFGNNTNIFNNTNNFENNNLNLEMLLKNFMQDKFDKNSMNFFSLLLNLMNTNKKPALNKQVSINDDSAKKYNIEKISGSDIALKIERYMNSKKNNK